MSFLRLPARMIGQTRLSVLTTTRLSGRWLLLARLAWIVMVACALALFAISLPAYYQRLQMPCAGAVACQLDGALTPAGIRTLQVTGFSLSGYAAYSLALSIILAVVWSAVGFVIFWKRSDERMALFVALALVLFNTVQQDVAPTALAITQPTWAVPVETMSFLSELCFGLFFYLFPDGRFAPRWVRWFALYYTLLIAFEIFPPADSPFNANLWPIWIKGLSFFAIFLSIIYSQIYRYRRISTSTQRQQVKWAVAGIVVSLAGVIALNLLNGFSLAAQQPGSLFEIALNTLFYIALLPIPLSLAFAILRYRLWDIDAIINKALVYGLLTALLAAVYVGLIIGLESLVGLFATQGARPFVLVVSTLAIAALFHPLRRRIQAIIDHRFYRRKYDAQKIVAAFSTTLRNEVDLSQLSEELVAIVQETMQPAHVSLWLRPPALNSRKSPAWSDPPHASQGGTKA